MHDRMTVADAKNMAAFLLACEFRGPGDTIDAAAYRAERRWGVPSALLLRLRYREVRDMLLSNYLAVRAAYDAAVRRAEEQYKHERALANAADAAVVRLADLAAGQEDEETG